MKASELRIGNYVTIDNPTAWPEMKGIPMQVTATKLCVDEYFPESTGSVRLEYGGDKSAHSQFDEFIQPIPLTSEWLERFGFHLVKESLFEDIKMKYWVNNRVCLFFNESEPFNAFLLGLADQRFGKYSVVTGDWIYYVHTLQNAFHAFTGNELTMKEGKDNVRISKEDTPG